MSRSFQQLAGSCVAALVLASAPRVGAAQQPQPQQQPTAVPSGPAVGEMAPDFAITGATRYGVLRDSVRLSDFRGQTVVLAFFPKARTKG
jgi:AhpC/TSA family